jgi:hypothetical protein
MTAPTTVARATQHKANAATQIACEISNRRPNQAMACQSRGAVSVPRSQERPHEIHKARRRAWFSRNSRARKRTRACVMLMSAGSMIKEFDRNA